MTRYEEGFIKRAQELGVSIDCAYGILTKTAAKPVYRKMSLKELARIFHNPDLDARIERIGTPFERFGRVKPSKAVQQVAKDAIRKDLVEALERGPGEHGVLGLSQSPKGRSAVRTALLQDKPQRYETAGGGFKPWALESDVDSVYPDRGNVGFSVGKVGDQAGGTGEVIGGAPILSAQYQTQFGKWQAPFRKFYRHVRESPFFQKALEEARDRAINGTPGLSGKKPAGVRFPIEGFKPAK